jgi:hypothetical protein
MMSVEQSVEWELAVETEVLGEIVPHCHYVHHKSHMPWPTFEPVPPRCATNHLSYDTAKQYVISHSECGLIAISLQYGRLMRRDQESAELPQAYLKRSITFQLHK